MFHRMMNYGELEVRPTVVLTKDIIKKAMPKFKRHDNLIVIQELAWENFKKSIPIPVVKEENSPFSIDEDELASLVCQAVQKPICRRLAVEREVKNDNYRTPNIELVLGDNGIVIHKENHITYRFDITKCMFSFGNINEKMRMAELDCSDEIVVDLFAGIGYFSLPLLVHAKAKHLYACEWNPDAIEAFKKNLIINRIDQTRCTVIEGDNRSNRPTDVAQRVILGILPSCLDWMKTAFECIDKSTGAILHCHDLVESKPPSLSNNNNNNNNTNSNNNSNNNNKDTSNNSYETASSTTDKSSSTSQLLLNQSLSSTSSASSHSTIEKLSAPSDLERTSESDKETSSSPVFLDKPTGSNASTCFTDQSSITADISSSSSYFETDSINETSPPIVDQDLVACEARARTLIAQIRDEVEAHDLKISLMHIKPVKSYAPYVRHVVFDIKIEPESKIRHDPPEFPTNQHL